MKNLFSNKNVLISGGNSGLGLALTTSFLNKGANVVSFCRNVKSLQPLQEKFPQSLYPLHCDLSDNKSILEAIQNCPIKTFDILINNAGYGQLGPIAEIDYEEMLLQYKVNVFGVVALSQAVIPLFRRNEGALILNIGSSAGKVTSPFNGIYASTKHALESISDAMRLELKKLKIRVVLAEPGKLDTPYNQKSAQTLDKYIARNGNYSNQLTKFKNIILNSKGQSVDEVAEILLNALSKKNPPARIVCDNYTRFIFILKTLLPSPIYDFLISKKTT